MNCHQCGQPVPYRRPSYSRKGPGRPWKHPFCGVACYNRWRADRHLALKAEWLKIQRSVWGTTPLERAKPAKARAIGRVAEIRARDIILPGLGFTEITDLSGMSNQFFIDFVATKDGARVLVDATIKLNAYIPEKSALAGALRMPLFILHVSPAAESLFYLHKMPDGQTASKVPAAFIRALIKDSDLPDR